jgi:TnpA family transposase
VPQSVPGNPSEDDIRVKYSQDLVRLANHIKLGSTRSDLLLICNASIPAVNSLYKAIVEMMFAELETVNGQT